MVDERSAGAVVFHRGNGHRHYLLLHYQAGHWGHVKGHLEEGETLEETLHREAEEETGLTDLRLIDGFHEVVTYTFRRGPRRIEKRVDFFLAETRTAQVEVRAPDEHQAVAWLPYEEALDRLTFEEPRRVLKAAHAFLER